MNNLTVSDFGKCESCYRQSDVRCATCRKFCCMRHQWSNVQRVAGSIVVLDQCRSCAGVLW